MSLGYVVPRRMESYDSIASLRVVEDREKCGGGDSAEGLGYEPGACGAEKDGVLRFRFTSCGGGLEEVRWWRLCRRAEPEAVVEEGKRTGMHKGGGESISLNATPTRSPRVHCPMSAASDTLPSLTTSRTSSQRARRFSCGGLTRQFSTRGVTTT